MSNWSPTTEGFRTIFRRPALSLAEITWRWCFGAAASVLGVLALFEYLDSLPVSNRDLFFLRTGAPSFVLRALAHILGGSGSRLVFVALVVCAALSVLWIVLASLGRAATLAPLIESIRARARSLREASAPDAAIANPAPAVACDQSGHPVWSLAGLHGLRVFVFALAVLAFAGALFGASSLSRREDPHPGVAFLAFLCLGSLIVLAVTSLNWLLSLATLFVVRNNQDSFEAISSAIDLCQSRMGPIFAVGAWFGFAHLTFFIIATSVVGFPLSFLAIVPPGFVLIGVILVTLLYLAIADSLYIGRLAGYAAILEAPVLLAPPLPPSFDGVRNLPSPPAFTASPTQIPVPSSAEPNIEASVSVDQSEVILSDTPAEADAPSTTRHRFPEG